MSVTTTFVFDSDINGIRLYAGAGLFESNPLHLQEGETVTFKYERLNGDQRTPPASITLDALSSEYFTSTTGGTINLNGELTRTTVTGGIFDACKTTKWNDPNIRTEIRVTAASGDVDSARGYYDADRFDNFKEPPGQYGMRIFNGTRDVAIDRFSSAYAVKDVINVDPNASNITANNTYPDSLAKYALIELAQGDYPASGGLPIPAISCTNTAYLVPPRIYGEHPDGSYRYISCTLPTSQAFTNFNVAILVDDSANPPQYYGNGKQDDGQYGLEFFNDDGVITWSSRWRQCVATNVLPVYFDSATMENASPNAEDTGSPLGAAGSFSTRNPGNFDVKNPFFDDSAPRYDGVWRPIVPNGTAGPNGGESEINFALNTTGASKRYTNLNKMDPANTYVLGNCVQGWVRYYDGDLVIDGVLDTENLGGGLHTPAVRIIDGTTATVDMWRYSVGGNHASDAQRLTRDSASKIPTGSFVLARIKYAKN